MTLPVELGSVLVAGIAATGAWASQRSAAKASTTNAAVTSRLDAEKEAYERARKFDIETIERQAEQLKNCATEIEALKKRLARIEDKTPLSLYGLEGLLSERYEEKSNPGDQE